MSKIISTVLGSKLNAGSWIFREKQDLSCREPDRKESNAIQRLFEGKEGFGVQVHLDFKWKNLHEKRQRLCCPLFKSLEIIKFLDLVTFHLAIFMYKYRNQLFPSVFNSFFTKISQIHTYNTIKAWCKTVLLSSKSKNKLWYIQYQISRSISMEFH